MFELLVHSDALNFDNHNRLNFVHSDVVGILKHCSYALMFSRPPPMSHQLKHSLPTIFTCGPVIHWQAQCFTLTIFFYVHPQSVCPMHLWQVGMKWYRAHNDLRCFHRHVTTAEDAETRRGGGGGPAGSKHQICTADFDDHPFLWTSFTGAGGPYPLALLWIRYCTVWILENTSD